MRPDVGVRPAADEAPPCHDSHRPTIGTVTAADAQAAVAFSPPASNGGAAVISYTMTAADSTTPANGAETASGSGSPITVTGLTNGDTYTFTVTATSAPSHGRIRDRNYGPERFRPTTWRDSFTFAGRWSRSDSIETSLVGRD